MTERKTAESPFLLSFVLYMVKAKEVRQDV